MKKSKTNSIFSKHFLKQYRWRTLVLLAGLLLLYWFSLPSALFKDPTCRVLEAQDGSLLGAKIATDGQWRFPYNAEVPEKFAKAIVSFEDKRFYSHPGVDILALGRAFKQNFKNKHVISGGSTITMQVIRLSRKGKPRTVFQKVIEIILATRLEIKHPKSAILALYCSHAPFGGNVVGLDAASWRYYGKGPRYLSWGEAATLAVLPNTPSLIHPGRNRDALLDKRNRLLKKLLATAIIDQTTFELAVEEPLPGPPQPLPRLAPHLLERAVKSQEWNQLTRLRTTIDKSLQMEVNRVARQRNQLLKNNEIHNLAVLVLDIESNKVAAYVGNAEGAGLQHAESVDIISAPRSTGSIMKPFLYAMLLQEGSLLPESLVPDVPTYLKNYRPQNYLETYDGMISAKRALSRSLNIPFVRLLQQYGTEKFHFNLKKLGLTTLNRSPQHYGLTIILGGAEATLWDLTNTYAGMARTLNHFYPNSGRYNSRDFLQATYTAISGQPAPVESSSLTTKSEYLSADAIWFTFEAMKELERPNLQGEWERFESATQVAWKTGTSFGFRDAWAIGVTPEYAVGVWVGNADGEGRPGLVGFQAAAPLLFEVIELLPRSRWFDPPYDAMRQAEVCKRSGFLALDICEKETAWVTQQALSAPACPFHRIIHVDESTRYQVNSDCEPVDKIKAVPWFILPPVEAQYFKPRNPTYQPAPPLRADCPTASEQINAPLQLIYPKNKTRIYVPFDLDGLPGRTVFKAAHMQEGVTLHWHIDNAYIGSTTDFHNMELNPVPGKHTLTIVDEHGGRLEQRFEILTKDDRN